STQIKDTQGGINGNRTRVKVVKNKVAPPFKTVEFDILYGKGISKNGELLDIGVEQEIIQKSGSWFSYGDTKLGQGRDSVIKLLEDNLELAEEIEDKIRNNQVEQE
ncbi:MAG: DNA recombination/repair protein RecA, partial [Flavobacteriaceae bacterium]